MAELVLRQSNKRITTVAAQEKVDPQALVKAIPGEEVDPQDWCFQPVKKVNFKDPNHQWIWTLNCS